MVCDLPVQRRARGAPHDQRRQHEVVAHRPPKSLFFLFSRKDLNLPAAPIRRKSVQIELRVECKLETVGTVVARASARWLRLILGHAQASDVSSENC